VRENIFNFLSPMLVELQSWINSPACSSSSLCSSLFYRDQAGLLGVFLPEARPHHYAGNNLSVETHKITLRLSQPRIKIGGAKGTLTLGEGQHFLLVQNAVVYGTSVRIWLPSEEEFFHTLECQECVDLSLLAPGQLCFISSSQSLKIILQHSLVILTSEAKECKLLLEAAFLLEYWAHFVEGQPLVYQIENAEAMFQLENMLCSFTSGQDSPMIVSPGDSPSLQCCQQRQGFSFEYRRFKALRRLQVWHTKERIYFWLDGQELPVVLKCGQRTLLLEGKCWAAFKVCEGKIYFVLVEPTIPSKFDTPLLY
jgi:hypothetical protein